MTAVEELADQLKSLGKDDMQQLVLLLHDQPAGEQLLEMLRYAEESRLVGRIVAVMVETIQDHRGRGRYTGEIQGVLFNAMSWDDGHYVESSGLVHMQDGPVYRVDFPLSDLFDKAYGLVGEEFAVGVKFPIDGLLPGELLSGDHFDVVAWLGIDG